MELKKACQIVVILITVFLALTCLSCLATSVLGNEFACLTTDNAILSLNLSGIERSRPVVGSDCLDGCGVGIGCGLAEFLLER